MSPLPPARPPFSAVDAAFAGFRLARREPLTLLVWAALSFVLYAGLGAVMVVTMGPQMMALQAQAASGAKPDPAQTLALMQAAAPGYGIVFLVSLLFYGVIYAAVNRAVLRPAGAPGRLGVGVDELLQIAVLVLVWIVLFVVYLASVVLVALVGGGVAAASKPAGAVVVLVGALGVAAAVLFVMVRLSLASPLALDQRKLDLAAAWRMTRGRFWPLLGAYALAFLTMAVIALAAAVVFATFAVVVGGGLGAAGVMFHPDMSSVSAYFSGVMVAWLVVGAAVYGLFFAVALGAPAEAYRQLKGGEAAAPAASAAADRSTAFGASI